MSSVDVKVIKPPIESVRSGSIFKPSKAYTRKCWTQQLIVAVGLYLGLIIGTQFMARFMAIMEPEKYILEQVLASWMGPVMRWGLAANLLWLVPLLVITPLFVATIEYSVRAESGEAMPEIYVKKGLFTRTIKHVPFRTITNISSVAGVFDRIFGIGSVHVETAGNSAVERGPEEVLEGIVFYDELRDYILTQLRKFRDPYVIGTEVCYPSDAILTERDRINREMLDTLKKIQELLEKEEKKHR